MSDIKYMKYRTYCPNMAALHGKPKTKTDWVIQRRSKDTHSEIQFSDRYGDISFSATMADDCKCARFKKIAYSHPERWKTVLIPVTAEQEEAMFEKACQLADLMDEWAHWDSNDFDMGLSINDCLFGKDAVKYDLPGVTFGFISHRKIWKPSKTKMWCTECCYNVLLAGFPDILRFGWIDKGYECVYNRKAHDLQPTQGDEIARNYFK